MTRESAVHPAPHAPQGPPSAAAPSPRDVSSFRLIQALRRYSESADRATDMAGSVGGHHRTDLRALTVLMQRHAEGLETTPTDLARLLHLTSASTTALVDRLVANGHAKRERSSTDRRRVLVRHTDSATQDGRAIFAPLAQHLMRHLSEFTEQEMQTAAAVLEAATAGMLDAEEQIRGTEPPRAEPSTR